MAKLSALGDGAGWQCGGTCRQAVPDGPDRGTCRIPHLQSKSGCTIHLSAPNVAPACGQSRHSVSRNLALSQCCQQERTSVFRSLRTLQQNPLPNTTIPCSHAVPFTTKQLSGLCELPKIYQLLKLRMLLLLGKKVMLFNFPLPLIHL